MPTLSPHQLAIFAWDTFLIVWLIAAARRKPDKATEPLAARLLTIAYISVAFCLLFWRASPFAWLNGRFMPHEPVAEWTGAALAWAGAAIAIWARLSIGDNWSARVNVKVGHQLVRSGPYAYVRHPIYSGFLLSAIGTALTVGEWRALVAVVIVGVVHSLKARREERMMSAEFGDSYAEYRRHTGFLVPRF